MAVLLPSCVFYTEEEIKEMEKGKGRNNELKKKNNRNKPPVSISWAFGSKKNLSIRFINENRLVEAHYAILPKTGEQGKSEYIVGVFKLAKQARESYFRTIVRDWEDYEFKPYVKINEALEYIKDEAEKCATEVVLYNKSSQLSPLEESRAVQAKIKSLVESDATIGDIYYHIGKETIYYIPFIRWLYYNRQKESKGQNNNGNEEIDALACDSVVLDSRKNVKEDFK